jgi:hypothetical protein
MTNKKESKRPNNNKDEVITVNGNKYSFKVITTRSKFAPLREVDLIRVRGRDVTGIKQVDESEIRVCKIGKTFHLLSGHIEVNKLITDANISVEERLAKKQLLHPVKVMGETYFDSAKIEPVIEEVKAEVPSVPIASSKVPNKPVKEHKHKVVSVVEGVVNEPNGNTLDKQSMIDQFKSAGYKVRQY